MAKNRLASASLLQRNRWNSDDEMLFQTPIKLLPCRRLVGRRTALVLVGSKRPKNENLVCFQLLIAIFDGGYTPSVTDFKPRIGWKEIRRWLESIQLIAAA
jgi:hypothetical protein